MLFGFFTFVLHEIIFLLQGQFFSGNSYKIYLLGNPVIWWSNIVVMVLYNFISIWKAIGNKRRNDLQEFGMY